MTYSAEVTTVTDPAGNQRQQKVDALGRLIEVIEDPGGSPLHLNYITTYAYDALDNLTEVTQIQASHLTAVRREPSKR
jgi:YD repeat-containing protein